MTVAEHEISRVIIPPSRLLCSEFAEADIYLPSEGNAEPGKYHADRMPWQIDMLDDVHDDTVDEHAWQIASQLGKTLSLIIIICFFVKMRPKKILVVYPKLEDARDWMRDKFILTVDESPAIAGLIKSPRDHKSGSRDLNRKFPGGGLVATGSISTSSLRRLSAGVVIQDEIDDFETTKQGDSMALADLRAATFANAFKLKSSTPTNAGESRIAAKFEASDQQHFFLPCLHCGEFMALELRNLKFSFSKEEAERFSKPGFHPGAHTWDMKATDVRDTRRAMVVCEHCSRGWSDVDRIAAIRSRHPENLPVYVPGGIARAEWRATAPKSKIKGRRLPGFYRLIGKPPSYANYLHWFAELFLTEKAAGIERLRVWTNTFEARPFEAPAEKIEWSPLQARAEEYGPDAIPPQLCLLVAGVDIQPDRVEILTVGFGDGEESWPIAYDIVWGRFDSHECQERVNEVLLRKFAHPVLGELAIVAVGMDTGHQTKVKEAYQFCRAHAPRNVWAFKGSSHALATAYTMTFNKVFNIKLFSINTDFLKTTIFDRLKNPEPGHRYIHFPKLPNFNEKFYKMLCSEKRMAKKVSGHTVYYWEKVTARNEVLDMLVYAFAAFDILKPQSHIAKQWAKVQAELKKRAPLSADAPAAIQPPKEYTIKPPTKPVGNKRGWMKGGGFGQKSWMT